jgi:hypothetical protein
MLGFVTVGQLKSTLVQDSLLSLLRLQLPTSSSQPHAEPGFCLSQALTPRGKVGIELVLQLSVGLAMVAAVTVGSCVNHRCRGSAGGLSVCRGRARAALHRLCWRPASDAAASSLLLLAPRTARDRLFDSSPSIISPCTGAGTYDSVAVGGDTSLACAQVGLQLSSPCSLAAYPGVPPVPCFCRLVAHFFVCAVMLFSLLHHWQTAARSDMDGLKSRAVAHVCDGHVCDGAAMPRRARAVGAAMNFFLTAYSSVTLSCVQLLHCVHVPGTPASVRHLFIEGDTECRYSGWQMPLVGVVALLAAVPLALPFVARWSLAAPQVRRLPLAWFVGLAY